MSRSAERGIEKLLNQLAHLHESTESNNELSKLIFKKVSVGKHPKPNQALTEESGGSRLEDLIKMQSQILKNHKKILSEVENTSKELKYENSNAAETQDHNFNVDTKILIEQFVDSLGEYQNMVSILIHQNDNIQRSMRSKFKCLKVENINQSIREDLGFVASKISAISSQHLIIEKEITFVRKLLQHQDVGYLVPPKESCHEGTKYFEAQQSNLIYVSELENSRSLVQLLSHEIDTLQNSMAAILDEGQPKSSFENTNAIEKQAINLLQRQVKELRTVWSREVSANTLLRSLISKTQAERLKNEESLRTRCRSMQEEFDELAELFDESRKEIELLKSEMNRQNKLVQFPDVDFNPSGILDLYNTESLSVLNNISLQKNKDLIVKQVGSNQKNVQEKVEQIANRGGIVGSSELHFPNNTDQQNLIHEREIEWSNEREKILNQLLIAGEEITRVSYIISEKQEEILNLRNIVAESNDHESRHQKVLDDLKSSTHNWTAKEKEWCKEREELLLRIEQKTEDLSVVFFFNSVGIKH